MEGKSRWRRWGRAVTAVLIGGLAALGLAGCAEGTVTSNTNPKGDPNKPCKITIKVIDRDGGEESKTFEQDVITCRRCPVGAEFPKCKKERSEEEKKPPIQNQTRSVDRKQILGLLTVTLSSTHQPIIWSWSLYGSNGNVRDHGADIERSRDKTLRVPVVINEDRRFTVAAESVSDATVSCQITYAGGSIGLASQMVTGKAYCEAVLKGNPKIPNSG